MEIGDIAELCSSLSIKEGDGSVNVLGVCLLLGPVIFTLGDRNVSGSSLSRPSGEVQVVKPSDAAGLGEISESNLQVQTMVAGAVTPSVTAGLGENNDSGLQVQTMAVSAVTGDCCDNSVAGGKKGLVLCDGAVVGEVRFIVLLASIFLLFSLPLLLLKRLLEG
ncbi:hypothetical protein ACOSP7_014233 [Xanthoceras sorbifolium]